MARRFGADDAILEEASTHTLAPAPMHADPRTHAALVFAGAVVSGRGHVPEPVHVAVRAHFDEGELVELTAVIAAFMYFNTFNNALDVEVTR